MTILSDGTIRHLVGKGTVVIDPMPRLEQFQPVSIDMLLHPFGKIVRVQPDNEFERYYEQVKFPYALRPGECLIASTVERIELPDNIVARVEGKSTLGRLFLSVHETAGLVDPNFKGQITLEIKNNGPAAVMLKPKMKICQLVFEWVDQAVVRPYGSPGLGSHYQNQLGPTEPRTEGLA